MVKKTGKNRKKIIIIVIIIILLILAFIFLKKMSTKLEFRNAPDYGVGFKPAEKVVEFTDVNAFNVKTNPFER